MSDTRIASLLAAGLHPLLGRVHRQRIRELTEAFQRRAEAGEVAVAADDEAALALSLTRFLLGRIGEAVARLDRLRVLAQDFSRRMESASTDEARQLHMLWLAAELGASRRQLRGDAQAFSRWMTAEAMLERQSRRVAETERLLGFLLDRLAPLLPVALPAAADVREVWRALDLEAALLPLCVHNGDSRVREAAFRALASALRALPPALRFRAASGTMLQFVYRAAMDRRREVWMQAEALEALQYVSLRELGTALTERLSRPSTGDDLFVRARAVSVLVANLERGPEFPPLLAVALRDPSPYVRQQLAAQLPQLSQEQALPLLETVVRADAEPSVRAAGLLALGRCHGRGADDGALSTLLQESLGRDRDRFVLRTALQVAVAMHRGLAADQREAEAAQLRQALVPVIRRLHETALALPTRRQAAEALEQLWAEASPLRRERLQGLREHLAGIPAGCDAAIPAHLIEGLEDAEVGRLLSVLAQRDHGYEQAGTRVRRGHRFGWRLWRLLFESRHPSTAKRQAHAHTVGRRFSGALRAPSAILAELSETKVPGEPLFLSEEGGWRPYLPLPDELVSAVHPLGDGRPVTLYSAEGRTELRPPADRRQRWSAWRRLTLHFAELARLRNWREGDSRPASAYLDAARALGFEIRYSPHREGFEPTSLDPAVTRFFPAFLMPDGWQRFSDYFVSAYQNNLRELLVFLLGMGTLFFGRHFYLGHQLRRARDRLPLVVGGWGTRGKSGTERLKAALFNALGCHVVSKTTGCEAMFLHGYPNGELREMFLFRPYDKATIWEQSQVVQLAGQLGAEVFLWECMGLNPDYVEILQRQWMRDDLATLTNAYPDHEDIQGPAGINIPQVMTRFIPRNSLLITSEEQMLPILTDAARELGTTAHAVGWLEAGLIAPDLLARFPYEEHPYNIALVLRMASELGVAPSYAIKEMADRVVPDLGVLKAYPLAHRQSRRLRFYMGMSANERLGCLANWERMGFDQLSPEAQPGVFVSTVVNNRADRVARSAVFAGIVVNDVSADKHFLIGTNLTGLRAFIDQEWTAMMADIQLMPEPMAPLERLARRLRVPMGEDQVQARIAAMLDGLGIEASAARIAALQQAPGGELPPGFTAEDERLLAAHTHARRWREEWEQYQALAEQCHRVSGEDPALRASFERVTKGWFEARIEVVEDAHTSGNQIIDRITRCTPPGFENRIMGMQNIKGTGLDYVYAWEDWAACHRALEDLRSGDPQRAERGLVALQTFEGFNLLGEEAVAETLREVRRSSRAQTERLQAGLVLIEARAREQLSRIQASAGVSRRPGLTTRLLDALEALLDAGDAVQRRKASQRIYQDLVAERISHARAAKELLQLTKRQKGGWLRSRLAPAPALVPDAP